MQENTKGYIKGEAKGLPGLDKEIWMAQLKVTRQTNWKKSFK